MTVTVTETNGRCQALVIHGGDSSWCCEAGHGDAMEAARHALRLVQALARKATSAHPFHDSGEPAAHS